MLGIFGLLFGTAAIVKDEFVEMDINQRARESAYKCGNFYWTNTKGKHFTVEDNTPCYIVVRNGDRCVIRLKDDVLLKNLDAERKEAERKKKEEEEAKRQREWEEYIVKSNEESKARAIKNGDAIYFYRLTKEEKEKYTEEYTPWDKWYLYKDVKTGELFAQRTVYDNKEYFTPVSIGKTNSSGKIVLDPNDVNIRMTNNCYKLIRRNDGTRYYKRIKNEIKGLILD